MQTSFVVQTYSINSKRRVQADMPRQVSSATEAVRLAEKFSQTKFGVVAFSVSVEADEADWEAATILYQSGDFTQEDAGRIRSDA